ncbi:hypothetical protein QUA56_29335 [Microcoleus sp. N3A4]|uniref:hypothetical protein n=1 Tax=Microcoleus sp. N3A4 TaxID=3055379 RepID=UPI002FCEE830
MNTSRNDLKWELGLGTVKEITNVRKALGQAEWQQTTVSEADTLEVRQYYKLIREDRLSVQEAILAIANARTGTAAEFQNDNIDENAIDHSEHRDAQEETNELVVAVQTATTEAALAMTDVGAAAAVPVVDAFFVALGSNVADQLHTRSANTRSNFKQVVQAVENAPLDLRNASLPGKKTETPKRITGAWG